MFVNLSSLSISDASKFIDPFFSRVNVLQVTFITHNILDSSFMTDLFALVKSKCLLMLIQECGDDYAKCTFVYSANFFGFYNFLKLKIKLLVTKFGKEVFIYV